MFKEKAFLLSPVGIVIQKYLGSILFGVALLIGILTYDSYGLSWDDPMQRGTGIVNYEYIFHNDQTLLSWSDRDYGPVYEIFLVGGERAFGLTDTRDIYLYRHLCTHVLFLLGAFACFLLIDLLYKNKKLAALAFLMIVLHPRLYAHSFINTKDIPFLAMFFISFYFLALAFRRKRLISYILLGLSVGITVNLRIMGVMLLCVIPAFLIIDMILEKQWKWNGLYLLTFLSVCLFTIYATWPFLWPAPIDNFLEAFENMRKFRWDGDVLFNGSAINATNLPWYYLPEWISITTPMLFLILGVTGIILVVYGVVKRPLEYFSNSVSRNNLLYVACFFAPFLAVIFLESVVYDSWRQIFFVYSGFVMLMIFALHKLSSFQWLKNLIYITMLYLVGVSIYYFPYQNVYFNSFLEFRESEYIRKHFEMDYWGVANVEALRYILQNDDSTIINIGSRNPTPLVNMALLKQDERERLNVQYGDGNNSIFDYYIKNYRAGKDTTSMYWGLEYYEISRGRNTILTVYKLK